MQLYVIAAVDEFGGFGKDGKIPWNVPEDMKRFKALTQGGACIMGRITYENMLAMWQERNKPKRKNGKRKIPKEILPNRECYVVTSNSDFKCPGAVRVGGISEALEKIEESNKENVFFLGGEDIFLAGMNRGAFVIMTIIKNPEGFSCDKFFPVRRLNTGYTIMRGEQTESCYFVDYVPSPQRRKRQ